MKKTPLSQFTDEEIFSEYSRRRRAKATKPPRAKTLAPCPKCGVEMGARERRLKCPEHKPSSGKAAT